jgi:hypothetical protein
VTLMVAIVVVKYDPHYWEGFRFEFHAPPLPFENL